MNLDAIVMNHDIDVKNLDAVIESLEAIEVNVDAGDVRVAVRHSGGNTPAFSASLRSTKANNPGELRRKPW
jgi:hypothetical protein